MQVPDMIGGYRVLEAMAGGSAETELFKARRVGDESAPVVCLKRVHPNYDDNPLFAKRFEEELEIAQRLRHRNVVEVADYGEDGGHFFVMEYVEGASLEEVLGAGALAPSLVAYLGVEVCRALSFLHHSDPEMGRGPVIHGDLTPHNLLLGRDGGVKVADFGLAKALGRTGAETLARAGGKPTYMSPEQLAGEKVSSRTDLFSLGLVLWRALVGTHPYGEERPRGTELNDWIRQRTLQNARRTVAAAAPHASTALRDGVEGLLQPLATRLPTAEDVFALLRQVEPIDGHSLLAARLAEVRGRGPTR